MHENGAALDVSAKLSHRPKKRLRVNAARLARALPSIGTLQCPLQAWSGRRRGWRALASVCYSNFR